MTFSIALVSDILVKYVCICTDRIPEHCARPHTRSPKELALDFWEFAQQLFCASSFENLHDLRQTLAGFQLHSHVHMIAVESDLCDRRAYISRNLHQNFFAPYSQPLIVEHLVRIFY